MVQRFAGMLGLTALALVACGGEGSDDGGNGGGAGPPSCTSSAPLTGMFDETSFQPVAARATFMEWAPTGQDRLLVTLRDHPIDCTSSGGIPPETWMEVNIILPLAFQAVGAWTLDTSLNPDGPAVGAGRYVYLPEGGISNHIVVGVAGTVCIAEIDATHLRGSLQVYQEQVTLDGTFEADICPLADAGP